MGEQQGILDPLHQEEDARRLLEVSFDGVWAIDADLRTTFVNARMAEMLGYSPEEMRGRCLYEFLFPEDLPAEREAIARRQRGVREEFELRYRRKDGTELWARVATAPILARDGTFQGAVAILSDISRRKSAEQANQQLAAIVESSDDAIISKDLDGVITSWNSAASRIFGYAPEEAIGRSILLLIPPELRAEEDQILARLRRGERIDHYETQRVTKDGRRLQLSVSISPINDAGGQATGASEVARDVTERKRAESASSHLAAIVESSDDAIISKDLHGIITSWNAAATRLFGYTPDEAIGRSILILIPPELHADEEEILRRLRAGERIEHFQTQRVRKNGERLDVSLTISPVRDSRGRIIGASKIARDISDRKRAEQALLTSEKLATVGRLAATVAHEINNPLESVINLVYLARTAAADSTVQGYLADAERELNRIAHLTKQTLSFYRQRSEKVRARAGELLRELVVVFSSKAQNKSIRINVEIGNDAEILVDVSEFRQLFANLISNSIDACGPGDIIRVRASTSAPGLRVTVADNGSGIKPADRPHLFEAFFTTKKDVGTGLGLWICKQVAEKYGGSIRIRSDARPGRSWTVVSVFLPVTVSQAQPVVTHPLQRLSKKLA